MKDGLPLTKLQYQKDVWNTFAHNSKQTSYEILAGYSKVAPRCLEELSGIVFPRQQKFEIGNLKVEYTKDEDGRKKFTLSSVGSLGHNIPMIQHIKTTTVPSAWQCNKSKVKKQTKLKDEDENEDNVIDVLSLIPPEMLQHNTVDSEGNSDNINTARIHSDGGETLEMNIDDRTTTESISGNTSTTEQIDDEHGILQNESNIESMDTIEHEEGTEDNQKKWEKKSITPEKLYKENLANAEMIDKSFIVVESFAISDIYTQYTGGKLKIKKSNRKAVIVNEINKYFGDKSTISSTTRRKHRKIQSLANMAKNFIFKPDYPKKVLNAAVAKPYHTEKGKEWKDNTTIPLNYTYKGCSKVHEAYCYLERSEERNQWEPRLLDPTHLLTNMRVHVTTKEMHHSSASAFLHVSKFDDNILSRAIVTDLQDKQSTTIAMKVFSEDVQKIMEKFEEDNEKKELLKPEKYKRKVKKTSRFVKCMRNFYLACDARGYSPGERLRMLKDMYDLLTKDVDFEQYTPPSTHIKGIPIVTYEGILQNITLRFAFYRLAKGNRYNHRALSTLPVENFFGELSAMEFSRLGCPKSTDIMRLMGHVIQLIAHRLDPNR